MSISGVLSKLRSIISCSEEQKNAKQINDAIDDLISKVSALEEQMKNESKDQIELQLHEQYAVNNNANVNSIITFIVGIVAVLGAYGSVFINTEKTGLWVQSYTIDDLAFVGIGCILVLGIIAFVCIEVGARQRFEQFTIHAIRCKAYGGKKEVNNPTNNRIFNTGYHPFGKKLYNFVQGIFNTFWIASSIIVFLIVFSFVLKALDLKSSFECGKIILYVCPILLYIFAIGRQLKKKKKNYDDLVEEFRQYNPSILEDSLNNKTKSQTESDTN